MMMPETIPCYEIQKVRNGTLPAETDNLAVNDAVISRVMLLGRSLKYMRNNKGSITLP